MANLFAQPTVARLAAHLGLSSSGSGGGAALSPSTAARAARRLSRAMAEDRATGDAAPAGIAIVGLAGRFPGAEDVFAL
ncbi:MAG: hypothetical protein U1E17_06205 [Geminicoccaceae bacterium]